MAASSDAVVGFQLENLKEFVVSNAELLGSAQENANALCADLEVLIGFLTRCTEQRSSEDGFLSALAKKVRTLLYRAEDTIETYIATVSKQKFRGAVSAAFHTNDHARELRNIGWELDVLTKEVKSANEYAVTDEAQVMQSVNNETSNTNGGIHRKHPVDDDMIGFKDAMDDVMNYLKEGKDDLHTVSIYGMFGLGKTTLARQVFKHPTVEYQFVIRVFVKVSQVFKRKEVLVKLVRALGNVGPEEMTRMDETDLEKAIKEYLERRNYLIVLDGVWTKLAWDNLKSCFPNNNKRSRVLITTRNLDVAQHAMQGSDRIEPYKLRFLNPLESKQLLRKGVFGTEDGINKPELNIHEEAILAMCKGLPLALVVVAGIVKNNPANSFWWESVSKIGSDVLAKEAYYAIKMSFDHLPHRLKPCFLYLGVFREDSEIIAKTLYQLWVSEGFVPPSDSNETSEDIAEIFLEQLADRNLVMVEKRRFNGRIKTVRIHDTLLEFCKTKSFEEGLFLEIKYHEESPPASRDDNRRLCINSHVREYITSTNKGTGKYVRSFLSFAKEDFVLPLEYISEIPKAFKLLRVLDVRSMWFTRFPTELSYAFLLKYLAMCSDLKTIPEVVSNLRYLQTLIFHTTQRRIEIKADIWKMKQLRHLQTNATTSLGKSKEPVSNNLNLQTLSKIAAECCTIDFFKRAKKLKKLAISGELAPYMDTLSHLLTELTLLENLKLLNANGSPPLTCLPSKSNFPSKITRLTLQNTMLSWDWMSTLAKLEQLEVLKLKENAFVGEYWDTENSGGSFVALKVLHVGNTDLTKWKASKDHFPLLKQLYLKHCSRLKSIPSDLVNIETLKLIDIYCCNSDVADSARKLVLAKLQMQNQEKNKSTKFKLFVYPPQ